MIKPKTLLSSFFLLFLSLPSYATTYYLCIDLDQYLGDGSARQVWNGSYAEGLFDKIKEFDEGRYNESVAICGVIEDFANARSNVREVINADPSRSYFLSTKN